MNEFLFLLALGVLIYVIIRQYRNYRQSESASREIDDLLNELSVHSENKSSHHSGWKTELEKLDRFVAPHLDDIRRFSNAALVTGIGGTMGIFFIEALFLAWSGVDNLEITTIVQGAVPALLSSLSGIFFHLFILSRHLSEAQENVVDMEKNILDQENLSSTEGPTVNVNIGDAVQSIFQEIADTQKGVAESTLEMKGLLEENRETSIIQRNSAQEIQNGVKIVIEQLKSLPDDLRNSLEVNEIQSLLNEQQKDVLTILSDFKGATAQIVASQEKFTEISGELLDTIQQNLAGHQQLALEIHGNVQVLTEQMKSLPDDIRSSLEISEFFDRAAREHIHELHKIFQEHQNEMKNEIINNQVEVQRWLSTQIRAIVEKVFDDLQATINNTVVDPLNTMSKKLNAATNEMPTAANKFGTDLIKSADTLSAIPMELEKVSEGINEVVRETAESALQPLSDEMKDFVGTVQDTHQRLENTIHGLVNLIKKLIMGIEGRSNEKAP